MSKQLLVTCKITGECDNLPIVYTIELTKGHWYKGAPESYWIKKSVCYKSDYELNESEYEVMYDYDIIANAFDAFFIMINEVETSCINCITKFTMGQDSQDLAWLFLSKDHADQIFRRLSGLFFLFSLFSLFFFSTIHLIARHI